MVYKYFPKNNYEDFSSGRVIFHKSGYPNYPVRLAGETFCRCLKYIDKTKDLCIYDPCCGSAYMLPINKYAKESHINALNSLKNIMVVGDTVALGPSALPLG
jgi:hypothetical protein